MKRAAFSAGLAVAFTAVIVSAQDKNMSMNKMDHMSIEKTYSGCLESNQTGSYNLTHLMAADAQRRAWCAAAGALRRKSHRSREARRAGGW